MNAVCPSSSQLDQFLVGRLAPTEETVIVDHVERCSDCQRYLVDRTEDSDFAKQLLAANVAANRDIPDSLRRRAVDECSNDAVTAGHGEPTGGAFGPLVGEPPSIPGYEVQSVLGQGGLGVVYRALHRQLRRIVAIKLLRQQPSTDERERLRREAAALASLHHLNIVQIHEAGEVDGRPYLVLEYVAGGSLNRFTAHRPVAPRHAAKIIATVASAIHSAHQKGLVHRDLKPANILLDWGSYTPGENLTECQPKLTDFGLVRDIAAESDLTHKRDLIGTPAYMSPEQAAGIQDVGPSVDIWALGAVLYELLTGRPPFQGPTALDTLVQVRFSDAVPPSRLQPGIPRDLETICLKCLNKQANDRYLSAFELAGDLNRWLEGRSISARRTPTAMRIARWCRRNPLAASLAGIAAVLLMTMAIAGPFVAVRESRLREEAAARAKLAEKERLRADKNLNLATQALDETLHEIYATLTIRPESIPDLDREASGPTIPYLETLVKQDATTSDQHLLRAKAKRQLARVLPDTKESERAKSLFADAHQEFSELVNAYPDRRDYQRELALCHYEFGMFLLMAESLTDGEAQINRALDIQQTLASAMPDDQRMREELGNTLSCFGEHLARHKTSAGKAKASLTQALEIRKCLRKANPNKLAYAQNEAFTRLWLSRVLIAMQETETAIDIVRDGIDVQRTVAARKPADPETMFILAHFEQHLGFCLASLNRFDEAKAPLDISAARYDRLAAAFPAAIKYNGAAAKAHDFYRRTLAQQKQWLAAVEQDKAALFILQRLARELPSSPAIQADIVSCKCYLAESLVRASRIDEASQAVRQAQDSADALSGLPQGSGSRQGLAQAYLTLAEAINSTNTLAALDFANRAVTLLSRVSDKKSSNKNLDALLERAQMNRNQALRTLGEGDDARAIDTGSPEELFDRE